MTLFLEIGGHYAVADAGFAAAEQRAFVADDDAAFDEAGRARQHNDQAYFLYLFTRLEADVNTATETLLAMRLDHSTAWSDRRVWQAWSQGSVRDMAFLSKVEVLTDKGRQDYARVKDYYKERNNIAHGGVSQAQFFVPTVAQTMTDFVALFSTS